MSRNQSQPAFVAALKTDMAKIARLPGTTSAAPWTYDVTTWTRHDRQGKPNPPKPPEEDRREEGCIGHSWELAGTSESGSEVIGYWKRK